MNFARFQAFKIFALLGISILGLLLNLHNVSDYKFYPDSYISLVVEKNIEHFGSAVGTLGPKGMLYPDIFFWSRPMFPTLLAILQQLHLNFISSAYFLNNSLSILSIGLVYLLLRRITKSEMLGLAASLVFAVSFNRVVWSGFILTEATSIFFTLVFLNFFFYAREKNRELLNIPDLFCGISFILMVATRYELILLILPVIFLSFKQTAKPWLFLLNFFTSAFVVSEILAFWLRPWPYNFSTLFSDFRTLIFLSVGAIAAFIVYYLLIDRLKLRKIIPWILLLLIIAGLIFIPSFRMFAIHDFLLMFMFLIFVIFGKGNNTFNFIFISLLVLGLVYIRINPEIERYWSDLLPIFIIGAGIGMEKLEFWAQKYFPKAKKSAVWVIIVFLGAQIVTSFVGLHRKDKGIWFQTGYEEVVSREVARKYPSDNFLLVSFPEPYYIFTGKSIQSVNDAYPYIFIDNADNATSILIVKDFGMVDQFPRFSRFLSNLQSYRIDSFDIDTPYRFADQIKNPDQPVVVYRIRIGELKEQIKLKSY